MSDEKPALENIKYEPTDGLTYNPNENKYWDENALQKEIIRTFDLCHSCRMCFKFCQSFPTLFRAVDELDGDVRQLSPRTTQQVVDECFQCKLCYTNCPYTAAEGHPYVIDFPRLMLRANAIRRRKEGVPFRERMLGDPDRIGKIGSRTASLANWANSFRPHRILMEKFMGVHRDKLLPRFAGRTFRQWFLGNNEGREETATGKHPVVLFPTCFVNYNNPAVGEAALAVLAHNDCRVACPDLNCCGMPALDGGDLDFARKQAAANVRRLRPYAEKGYRIAVVNPTCSLMMRSEYPELLSDYKDREVADASHKVVAATRDISEFLNDLRKEGDFKEDFKSTPGAEVAYHTPCHLRMQSIGFRGRDLMRRIPGVKPKLVMECCGHDGTWAMKREYFELSQKNGQKAFDGMQDTAAEVWSTDCPLAALQFEQACGRKAHHPVEVLAKAYREGGFPTAVSKQE
ncbi:MAG: anaerobic glycerol-3-phosphate dehydrogenase subunit C [Candidatus Eisenbacteria bacterium]|nr:anaerobic glycerol-3-phosphate dehydrogenase subunit C [Candidatus Eisenbacteria bacterium]